MRTGALLMALLILFAGCAPQRRAAPVEDRRPPRAAAPAKPAAKPAASQRAPAAPVAAATDEFYVVKRGDTLYSIALEHGGDYRELAQLNNLDDPSRINVGQQLRVKPPPQQVVQVGAGRPPGRVEARPLESVPEQKPRPEIKTEPQAVATAQPQGFVWPAKGKLLAGFAEPRRKGIDIDGKVGDPVIAAAAGRVTYVGSGIPGLGKLVVIKHDHGYITVYAHNKDIVVKEQQAVTRGQKIAELGSTDAERPKLHFQIRKDSAAVDPLLYLPKS